MGQIKYTSANGFTGILYGTSSMSIGKEREDGTFDEYLHTASRNTEGLNTEQLGEYLRDQVDNFPKFLDLLHEATEKALLKELNDTMGEKI